MLVNRYKCPLSVFIPSLRSLALSRRAQHQMVASVPLAFYKSQRQFGDTRSLTRNVLISVNVYEGKCLIRLLSSTGFFSRTADKKSVI